MLCKVVAEELSLVTHRPSFCIGFHFFGFAGKRTYHLLLADKEMCPVIVKGVDSWERTLAVGDEHVGGDGVVFGEPDLYLTGFVAVALFFSKDFYVITFRRCGWGSEHAVKNLLTSSLTPLVEVLDVAIAPCQRICEVGYQRLGIYRQVTLKLVFIAFLLRYVFLLCRCRKCEHQPKEDYLRCFFNHII